MRDFFPDLIRRTTYFGEAGISGYRRYRIEVAEDCLQRCVYCDCRKDDIGGDPVMELDHFRPKSIFTTRTNDPTNLVLACRSCNRLKKNDWPAGNTTDSHIDGEGYVDPFVDKRQEYFRVDEHGAVIPLKAPARYVERRLALNRPLLKRLRYRTILVLESRERINEICARIEDALADPTCPQKELLQDCLTGFRKELEILKLLLPE
ncbi:MAG: HNH endonuclease [Opitutaceae bacterium]|nr:HNH endonuclease [Opitutaceae bacterium]